MDFGVNMNGSNHNTLSVLFSLSLCIGQYYNVINFTDITTSRDLERKLVIFEFKLDPLLPLLDLSEYHHYEFRFTWKQLQTSGIHIRSGFENRKPVKTGQNGTYLLVIPLKYLAEGQLLVNIAIWISCLDCFRSWRCSCTDWQFTVISDPLEISAKRGEYGTSMPLNPRQ